MSMRRHPQVTTESARSGVGGSRWLTLAVALCGALAGGSVVEAIAAVASRTATPVAPDHLIAEPLALAGALCGGLLAGILVSKDRRNTESGSRSVVEPLAAIEVAPGEPMLWQPTPQTPQSRLNTPEEASDEEVIERALPRNPTIHTRDSHHAIHQHTLRRRP